MKEKAIVTLAVAMNLIAALLLNGQPIERLPNAIRRPLATGNGVGVSSIEHCDENMAPADWTSTVVVVNPLVSSAFVTASAASGGNPGQYEEIQLQPGANGVVKVAHLMGAELIDQSADGVIMDVSGSIDVRRLSGSNVVQIALLVEQQGRYYAGPLQPVQSGAWTKLSWSKLAQTAFTNVVPGGTPFAPLFECGATPMRIGFLTATSITVKDRPKIGVDNWCMAVRTRCCMRANGKTLGRSCCDEPLKTDNGVVVLPDMDPQVNPEAQTVNEYTGQVGTLYPNADTSTDLWYGSQPCDECIGGEAPPEVQNPDIGGMLSGAGIDAKPEEIRDVVHSVEDAAVQTASTEKIIFPSLGPVSAPYPTRSQRKLGGGPFNGRDIVFVHGLDTDVLLAKLNEGDPDHLAASTSWITPTIFNASDKSENPLYYDGGYFKNQANAAWSKHIAHYFTSKGFKNRYLIVTYNSNDRMEVAVQAVLRQVADAMIYGEGVVDPTNQPKPVLDFGQPSLVFVSYSTGCPLTDIALSAAATYPNLGVGFIPDHTKAVVASHGVFSGSRYASAALTVSGILATTPPWTCSLAKRALEAFANSPVTLNCAQTFAQLASSILVDLVPGVMQAKWGLFIATSPARTLTVAGGHPTESSVLKYLLQPGYDDGVSNANSQVANPAPVLNWPSGFGTANYPAVYDMPVAFPSGIVSINLPIVGTVSISSNMLNSPKRAAGYFIDEAIDKKFSPGASVLLPPLLVASGPIPWLSATGMRQPAGILFPLPYDPLLRTPRHYSYLFSASDHYEETLGPNTYPWYDDTGSGERNYEETRVITNPVVFQSFAVGSTNDNAPLLSSPPTVNEYRRGLRIRYRTLFRRRWVTRWVWSRRYYLLDGWEGRTEFDYVYDRVLK
jgi:hypothetical protein